MVSNPKTRVAASSATTPSPPASPLTVSQITTLIRGALERAFPSSLQVLGEISNFKRHTSGHLYFTLKDESSELSCVMWRSEAAKLRFTPADGLSVVTTGSIEVFERAGRYQLYVRRIEPRGTGALELAFRQLCEKLRTEGLFSLDRKRPLPFAPRRVAIATSPTGAALSDLLRTIERRFPCVEILFFPVQVQGDVAAKEIATAIRSLNTHADALGGIDVLIIGRGGGSIEDLWAFNDEALARAIHASRIPIVSAVGHETDLTVSDLVADVRAATPTAAGELVVPVLSDVLGDLDAFASRLRRRAHGLVELGVTRCTGLQNRAALRDPLAMVRRRGQVLDLYADSLGRTVDHLLAMKRSQVEAKKTLLSAVSHESVLARGFSITRTKKGRRIVRSVSEVRDRERLITQVADGEFESEVLNVHQKELFD